MTAPVLWEEFVTAAGADAAMLAEAAGRLAIAIERAIDRLLDAAGVPDELAAAIAALRAALVQLAGADRSGARVEGLALDEMRRAIEAGDPAATGPAHAAAR